MNDTLVREDSLTLVRLLDTYRPGDRWSRCPEDFTGDAGLFYAIPSDFGSDYVTLVCAADDPRRGSMWNIGAGARDRYGLQGDHYGWNVPRAHVEPAEAPTAPDADALARAREEGRQEGRREVEAEVERWKDRAVEIAHRYADDNSLCGEFDACMREIGLPERSYSYTAEVTLTVTYDGERGDDVYAALHRHFLHSCDTDEITVDDVNVSDVERQ